MESEASRGVSASEPIRLLTRRRYFNGSDEIRDLDAGPTLREIVDGELEPGPYRTVASIGGVEIEERHWPLVKPKPGANVALVRLPMIGGIISAIIGFLASYGQWVALAVSVVTSVVAGVLTKAPSLNFRGNEPDQSNQNPALTGSRNSTRLNGPLRTVFGKMLVFPDHGAKPFSETVGTDQYVRLLLDVGYGPLEISELKIGETPVANFGLAEGEDYVIHQGFDDDGPLQLFTQNVTEDREFAIVLRTDGDTGTITAEPGAHEGSLDIQFQSGLFDIGSSGNFQTGRVYFAVEYREAGSADAWQYLDMRTDSPGVTVIAPGDVTETHNLEIRANLRGLVLRGVSWAWPDSTKQYEIRLRRDEDDVGGNGQSEATWAVLRSISPLDTSNTKIPNLCQIEMRIRSTDQLNGVVDTVNCIAESIYPDYTVGGGFKTQTRTAADYAAGNLVKSRRYDLAIAELLRGPGNERPVSDVQIDLQSLDDWRAMTAAKGFNFDAVLDSYRNFRELCSDVCGSGRARFSSIDGRLGVVVNEKKSLQVTSFTHRNSWGMNVEKTFPAEIHGIKVNFVDAAAGYQPNEVIAYADGYDATNADLFEHVDLWGVTSASRAVSEGRFILAETILRPRKVTINTPIEGMTVTAGDLVSCNFTVMGLGLQSARITGNVVISSGSLLSFEVDEELPYSAGPAFAVRFRTSDGQSFVSNVLTQSSDYHLVRLSPALNLQGHPGPVAGDLVLFGESGSESGDFVVDEIRHGGDLSSRITLVDHSPALFDDIDSQPIPPFDPAITDPTPPQNLTPAAPIITSVSSDESVLYPDANGALSASIEVTWDYRDLADDRLKAVGFRLRGRLSSGSGQTQSEWTNTLVDGSERRASIRNVVEGLAYDLELISFTADGRVSQIAPVNNHLVVGQSSPPPPIENLRQIRNDAVAWDYPNAPPDLAGFRIRFTAVDAGWDAAEVVVGGLVTETSYDGSVLVTVRTTGTIFVRAEDRGGRLSDTVELPVTIDPSAENAIVAQTFEAPGWNGTKVECQEVGGQLHGIADIDDTFWGADLSLFWGAELSQFWPAGSYPDFYYYDSDWYEPSPSASGAFVTVEVDWDQSVPFEILYRTRPVGSSDDPQWFPLDGSFEVFEGTEYAFALHGLRATRQPRVNDMVYTYRKQTISELITDLLVDQASGTGVEVPLTQTFYKIRAVIMTLVNPIARPSVFGVTDKGTPNDGINPITTGPTAFAERENGTAASGFFDIQVIGWGA